MNKNVKKLLVASLSLITIAAASAGVAQWSAVSASAETNSTAIVRRINGASARVASATDSGLRFKAEIDRTQYEAIASTTTATDDILVGMMIVPADYITAAGGYTHEALIGKYGEAGIIDVAYDETQIGSNEVYAASIVQIKDANYTRDFVGIAYTKVGETYSYAAYDEENYARSVFEVASKAYNDRNGEGESKYSTAELGYMKAYMDGVADVKNENGTLSIANNTDYYTSPFHLKKDKEDNFYLDGGKIKNILYNGERKAVASFTAGSKSVTLVKSNGATWNEDGTVTLLSYGVASAGWKSGVCQVIGSKNSYIAFDADYGTGTTVEFTYTGNNMPQVCLFANTINSDITCGGSQENKGIIMLNGLALQNGSETTWSPYYTIWGPTRYYGTANDTQNTEYYHRYSAHQELTQRGLQTDDWKNVNFRYVLTSSVSAAGSIEITFSLYNADNGTQYYTTTKETAWSAATYGTGKIIAYAAVKGDNTTTTFGYAVPEKQTVAAGSLTVASKQISKTAGSAVALTAAELGLTVTGNPVLTYTVTKTLGAGTTRSNAASVHQAVTGSQFTVESGYFYDVAINATFADSTVVKEYVQVVASDLTVFGFEKAAETSVSIGSGYLQFEKITTNNNTALKFWSSTGTQNSGAWFEWGTLLSSANMAIGETVTYDVYADVSHSYDPSTNWALQFTQGGEGTVSGGYVTANARCKIGTVSYKTAANKTTMYSNFLVRGAYIAGSDYAMFDNVVFVRTDAGAI